MTDPVKRGADPTAMPAADVCERARVSRDRRFDGRFFVAVLTTGIYCRPICPARTPASDNVRYYPTAAAAEAAGYRPCLRCCPELAPDANGAGGLVGQALAAIDRGALDEDGLESLAASLGVSARHLNRVLREQTGATAGHFARTRRLHAAKRLIRATSLPLTEVAQLSGFRSVRRFNEAVQACWQRSPSALRAMPRSPLERSDPQQVTLSLPVEGPYDVRWIAQFLQTRAVQTLESADAHSYVRNLRVASTEGRIAVHWPAGDASRIAVTVTGLPTGLLPEVVSRLRALLDLDACPGEIEAVLSKDVRLRPAVGRWPGTRVPGTVDGFELAVRAILGQQVSVGAARTLTERLVDRLGEPHTGGRLFPTPAALADADVAALIGMPKSRGAAIRELARRTLVGEVDFDACDANSLAQALELVKGIGPWTAQYVAMRAARDPDAFIDGDLIVRRQMGFELRTPRRLVLEAAASWRPWRAYAAMLLWRLSAHTA